jgi:hypothetical protein
MWFGYKAWSSTCKPENHAATPIGKACAWCADPIMPDDNGVLIQMACLCGDGGGISHPWHLNCHLRSILGGINHQKRLCGCFGGDLASDPPELSAREAADAAIVYWDRGE